MDATYTVGELAQTVAKAVGRAFAAEVWVEGEIRDLRRSRGGHVYFTLADPEDPAAVLPVSLFAADRQAVNRVLVRSGAMRMTDGVHVRVRGEVGYHAARSVVRLRMTWIDTDYTLGRLAAERRALLLRLEAAGLLDRNAGLTVPVLPVRIGLITSVGSAAHADFLSELDRSRYGFQVEVVHARVQGPEAERDIAAAFRLLTGREPDLVALVRGGGAQTDLAAFDTEAVANAIAAAPWPVFTGIGHEIDTTVADRVAAAAFKTPTACAGGIIGLVRGFDDRIRASSERLARLGGARILTAEDALGRRVTRLENAGQRRLAAADIALHRYRADLSRAAEGTILAGSHRMARSVVRLDASAHRRLAEGDATLLVAQRRIIRETPRRLAEAERRVDGLEAVTRAHQPARMLARGWSLTHGPDGRLVGGPGDVAPGDMLVTTTGGGNIHSRVAGPDPEPAEGEPSP